MRRYHVTTFGCQMNAHDSERIKGVLEELGLGEAATADEADVVVFNTCTIREKPDTKLAAYLGEAAARKREHPDRVIAVGGCYAEAQRVAEQGVKEITLLGQNVNSWGRDLLPEIATEFGELLRACDAVAGIERIRFTSPHPKDFRDPVIAAMAECPSVCEHVHLPLQSGSSQLLKAMRRTYTRERYVALAEKLRSAIPDLAFGTDIIVGFPGETEDD